MSLVMTKKVANELCEFLLNVCLPTEVASPKKYLKLQKIRIKINDLIPEYRKTFKDYASKIEEERKPFQQALKDYKFKKRGPDDHSLDEEKEVLNYKFEELIRPLREEWEAIENEMGSDTVDLDIDSDSIKELKEFFSKTDKIKEREVTKGALFWKNPDDYIAIAELLGC